MASGGFFAFAKNAVPPEPKGAYRGGALTLKIFCWVAFIGAILSASLLLLAGLAFLLAGAVFGAMVEQMMQEVMPMGGGLFSGAMGVLMFLMMLVIAAFVLAIGMLMVWWASWTYARWVDRDARALTHALILGIVLAVFGGLSVLASMGAALVDPVTLSELVFGVLLIVFATRSDVKAVFAPPAPVGPTGPTGLA